MSWIWIVLVVFWLVCTPILAFECGRIYEINLEIKELEQKIKETEEALAKAELELIIQQAESGCDYD